MNVMKSVASKQVVTNAVATKFVIVIVVRSKGVWLMSYGVRQGRSVLISFVRFRAMNMLIVLLLIWCVTNQEDIVFLNIAGASKIVLRIRHVRTRSVRLDMNCLVSRPKNVVKSTQMYPFIVFVDNAHRGCHLD